ncbi:uncharacterized protein JCM6883_005635 [Sporobolomyces salmoneus]|uniref:uncharacterized protein n=1 Tax=Sporobolomyces salmoneus TaxID=183962 RepID=UPI0031731832
MFSTTSILSFREDTSTAASGARGGRGFQLSSIAFISLLPLAGPILVPILLDKLPHPPRTSDPGEKEEEGADRDDELEVEDGTSFVWISVENLLMIAALGISGSLKLGGFSNEAVSAIFAGFYCIALVVAWILIFRRFIAGTPMSERSDMTEFRLVKGNDEDETVGTGEQSSQGTREGLPTTTPRHEVSRVGLYDSRDGEYHSQMESIDGAEPPKRSKSQKLRSFFLTAGAGLKDEGARETDSAEALSLVALLKARQPSSVF